LTYIKLNYVHHLQPEILTIK